MPGPEEKLYAAENRTVFWLVASLSLVVVAAFAAVLYRVTGLSQRFTSEAAVKPTKKELRNQEKRERRRALQ